ncbi:hypothetical protein ES705_30928 [subsurface metagenome]
MTFTILLPYTNICINFSLGTFSGTKIIEGNKATAAYAAVAAPAFPLDAVITPWTPFSIAFEIATEVGLSLNEPEGFLVSSLKNNFSAIKSPKSILLLTSGVFPSINEQIFSLL